MSLDLAPKSKGHVRSIMHILFNWAMKWDFIEIDRMNPISLVRVEGSSKRLRQPRILSVKEFRVLLDELREPIRTMCIVAACLGLGQANLWACSGAISIGKLAKSIFNAELSSVESMK